MPLTDAGGPTTATREPSGSRGIENRVLIGEVLAELPRNLLGRSQQRIGRQCACKRDVFYHPLRSANTPVVPLIIRSEMVLSRMSLCISSGEEAKHEIPAHRTASIGRGLAGTPGSIGVAVVC